MPNATVVVVAFGFGDMESDAVFLGSVVASAAVIGSVSTGVV